MRRSPPARCSAVIEPQSTGIGGDCFALIQPQGEGKIIAYNGSGRAPKAANADWYLERKIHSVPLTSAHAVSIPGAIDAWATDPARSRQVRPRHAAAAGDQGGGRGLCRRPPHRLRLEEPVREAEERHQHRALSAAAWQAGGGRRRDPPAGARQDAARDRQGRPRRLLQGRDRRGHGRDAARHRRPAHAGRFRRAHHRDDLADRHHVQGPRRLAVPAERPGHHHAGDAQHPVALRSDEVRAAQRRALPSRSRSRAHRLHDARAAYRRSRPGEGRRGRDSGQGIRRGIRRQDPHGRHARSAERRAADESVDGLHHGGRQGPQRLLLHQFDRAFLRLGDRLQQDRHAAAEPRRRLPHPARPSQLHRAAASGRCTPSSRRSSPRTAAR